MLSRARVLWAVLSIVAMLAGPAAGAYMDFVATGNQDIGSPVVGDNGQGDPQQDGTTTYNNSYSVIGQTVKMYEMVGDGSDWWDAGEYAQVAYRTDITGDFRLVANVAMENLGGYVNGWMKAGVFIRKDLDTGTAGEQKSTNAVSAATWSNNGTFQYRPNDTANMTNIQAGSTRPTAVALERDGNVLSGYIYEPNADREQPGAWQLVNSVDLGTELGATPAVGLFVTSHAKNEQEKAYFWDVQYTTDLSDPLPDAVYMARFQRPRGSDLLAGEVEGRPGRWGVREVVNNGNINSVADAVDSLRSGTGTIHNYELFGAINIKEGTGDAKNFPGDGDYGVTTGGIVTGEVNHMSLLARGKVDIPTSGDWSFYINSDDGEELSIDNGTLVIGSEGWTDNNFGTVYLEAGEHSIQVIHREATGGADVEVAAAQGNTTDLSRFRLIGSGAAGSSDYTIKVPGITGDLATEATQPDAYGQDGTIQTALDAIAAGRIAGTNSTGTADRVNHSDPQDAGGGKFGDGEVAFPNDTENADNHFAFLAEGTLSIPETGTWYIGYDSDDGASLEIEGQTWLEIVTTNHTAETSIDGGLMKTDAWSGSTYTVGRIELAEGEYDFTFVSFEGSGGAFAEMFGSNTLGDYDLIISGAGRDVLIPGVADALELTPEPATMGLLALGALGLIFRRRRRR